MIETKVSLSLMVPGATMLSSQECEKNPKENYNFHKVNLQYKKGRGKYSKEKAEYIHFKTRKCVPAVQHINISVDSYNAMISTPTSKKFFKIVDELTGKRLWDTTPIDKRLELHLDNLAEALGALSYTYKVLAD